MDSVVRRLFYMCIDLCEINGSFYYLFWMDEEHAVQLMYVVKGDTFVMKLDFFYFWRTDVPSQVCDMRLSWSQELIRTWNIKYVNCFPFFVIPGTFFW